MRKSLFDHIFETTGINLIDVAIMAAGEAYEASGYDHDAMAEHICKKLDEAASEALRDPIVPLYPVMEGK